MNIINFIHELTWEDIPREVRNQARRCLLDTLGTAINARETPASQIIHDFSAMVFQGQGAYLWQDGRMVSPSGAALANGITIDSLDIHDGHKLTKGHAGAAIVPALFATVALSDEKTISGKELLTSLVVGYEIALRAGIALHKTVPDFHSSGAWNALGCAAITSRRLLLTEIQTNEALGIAEYYGPRSQIMRVVDNPSMLKDGSGWGAMTGISAGLLAANGFTGAPALTVETPDVNDIWTDLDDNWRIMEVYFKPYGVCRWAQPAIACVLGLQKKYQIDPKLINKIKVFTFNTATHLTTRHPQSTDQAQYSLPYPVAAALVYGRLGSQELSGESLHNPLVLRLADCVEMVDDPLLSKRFPAERIACVMIETIDGQVYQTAETSARWDPEDPPTDAELLEKFRWLAGTHLKLEDVTELERLIWNCAELDDARVIESRLI